MNDKSVKYPEIEVQLVGEDGNGTNWEYLDGRAVRNVEIIEPNSDLIIVLFKAISLLRMHHKIFRLAKIFNILKLLIKFSKVHIYFRYT